MTREIRIYYNWKCDQLPAIPEKHMEALSEDAEDRIFKMIKEGYNCGELSTTIRFGADIVPEENEDDGLTYRGWWSLQNFKQ
jgi:hypothetical protein